MNDKSLKTDFSLVSLSETLPLFYTTIQQLITSSSLILSFLTLCCPSIYDLLYSSDLLYYYPNKYFPYLNCTFLMFAPHYVFFNLMLYTLLLPSYLVYSLRPIDLLHGSCFWALIGYFCILPLTRRFVAAL
jgi:hypothetical protein